MNSLLTSISYTVLFYKETDQEIKTAGKGDVTQVNAKGTFWIKTPKTCCFSVEASNKEENSTLPIG